MGKIRLGISACLLGERVRYDGGHALDRFLRDTLGTYVQFVPVCPEVECGFGVPRATLRLAGDPKRPRLVTSATGIDHTDRMETWAKMRVAELEREDLSGFIFKSGSPSSGMERVKVYDDRGGFRKIGVGLFARIFMEHFPLTPVEEDGRLHDPILRENFIDRIFTCRRYREIREKRNRIAGIVAFHTRHKLLLMAHSPRHLRQIGQLVARAGDLPAEELVGRYEKLLMEAMALKSSTAKHTNVLQHMMGYFKKNLSADEKQELREVIDDYRRGVIPLIVPITLMNHYVRKYREPYLQGQAYLNPHPVELQLRSHV
ncbi:MAG: YbgA family protein [Syntrophales bacterium]